jgi:two-component system, sensor histidine kinase LadS
MAFRVLIMLVFITSSALGQDTVVISKAFRKYSLTKHFRYFRSSSITSPDSAVNYFLNHSDQTLQQESPFIGIVREPYWFFVTFKNLSEVQDFIFEIEHSHLRHIDLYEVRSRKVNYKGTVGELYPFYQRPILHRHFVLPIRLSQNASVGLLLYVKHTNTLALPTTIWSARAFYQDSYNFNLAVGACIGFLFFCSLFSLTAFLLLKKSIFGWYTVYLLSTTLYLFEDLGFAFQYLFPGIGGFDGAFSIYSPLLMFSGLVMFILEFLSVKENFAGARLFLVRLVLFLLSLIVVDMVFQESWRQYTFYVLPVVFSLVSLGIDSPSCDWAFVFKEK